MRLGDLRAARWPIALAVALALAVGGCGGGSTGGGTTTPTASAPDATAPPAGATEPGTGPMMAPPAKPRQPAHPTIGPYGGELRAHVRARFVITTPGHLRPRTITVPPRVAIRMSLQSPNPDGHRLTIETTPKKRELDIIIGTSSGSLVLPGLPPGRYPLRLDEIPAGTLIVADEAGP